MRHHLEFLLGILEERYPACVAQEDFDGPHGGLLHLCQSMGFLANEPVRHPVPSCPFCDDGVPFRLGDSYLCNGCGSTVDPRHMLLWQFDLGAFLRWLAQALHLSGEVRQIDASLWQLGTLELATGLAECFFWRDAELSAAASNRLAAFRNTVVLYCLTCPRPEMARGASISLLEVLRLDQALAVIDPARLLRGGAVRFDPQTGALWAGDQWLGEVPFGSKEFYFLDCLAQHIDHFVPYADIKHHVLQHTGSKDSTEEATLCQQLKNRIKRKGWIPEIDRLMVTTRKGDGYRLRGVMNR